MVEFIPCCIGWPFQSQTHEIFKFMTCYDFEIPYDVLNLFAIYSIIYLDMYAMNGPSVCAIYGPLGWHATNNG